MKLLTWGLELVVGSSADTLSATLGWSCPMLSYDLFETPHRYVCKLQTYVCKTRSQKRKGLIICKKMNQTWSFKYSDLLIAHDFLPFSQAELWAEESRCSVWPASRGWGSSAGSLSSLPNFFFRCREEIDHTGFVWKLYGHVEHFGHRDLPIYHKQVSSFCPQVPAGPKRLAELFWSSDLGRGKMGVALALEFHVEDLCQLCRASWNLVSCFFQRFSFHKILSDEEYLW